MRKYLLLLLLLVSPWANAQTSKAVIQKPTAPVYASASQSSEVLVTLKKGAKVEVAGVTETGWAKVKVMVSGFQFDGWVLKDAFSKTSKPTKAPAKTATKTATKATPAAGMTKSSSTELDQFFEPSKPSTSSTSSATASSSSSSSASESSAVSAFDEPKSERKSREKSSRGSGENWKTDRLTLYGVPGFAFHQYTFSDTSQEAFRYNLSGPSLQVGAEYELIRLFNELIHLRSQLQVQYVMFNTKTNLLDGTNTQFSDITAKNKLLDVWLKLKFMIDLEKIFQKPLFLGLTVGYDYMWFMGDDIIDDNGTPVGLYVGQTTRSVPVGALVELHFLDPVALTLGADVLIMNSASESPDASSGTQPKPKMGFAPYMILNFPIVGDTHFMGFRYQLRVQETSFTGPSSSRVNNDLNDAVGLHLYHNVGLEYSYHF